MFTCNGLLNASEKRSDCQSDDKMFDFSCIQETTDYQREVEKIIESVGAKNITFPSDKIVGFFLSKPNKYLFDLVNGSVEKDKTYVIVIYNLSEESAQNGYMLTNITINQKKYFTPTGRVMQSLGYNPFSGYYFAEDIIKVGSNNLVFEILKEVPVNEKVEVSEYSFGERKYEEVVSKIKVQNEVKYNFSKNENTISLDYMKKIVITDGTFKNYPEFAHPLSLKVGSKYFYYFNTDKDFNIDLVYETKLSVQNEQYKRANNNFEKPKWNEKETVYTDINYIYNEYMYDKDIFKYKKYNLINEVNEKVDNVTYKWCIVVGGSGFNKGFLDLEEETYGFKNSFFYDKVYFWSSAIIKEQYAKPLSAKVLELKYLDLEGKTLTSECEDIYRPVIKEEIGTPPPGIKPEVGFILPDWLQKILDFFTSEDKVKGILKFLGIAFGVYLGLFISIRLINLFKYLLFPTQNNNKNNKNHNRKNHKKTNKNRRI